MAAWTSQDWVVFFGSAGTFLGVVATVILQIIGNLRTSQAKAISSDNNVKLNAVVSQTNNIADAIPKASTAPTDALMAAANVAVAADAAVAKAQPKP